MRNESRKGVAFFKTGGFNGEIGTEFDCLSKGYWWDGRAEPRAVDFCLFQQLSQSLPLEHLRRSHKERCWRITPREGFKLMTASEIARLPAPVSPPFLLHIWAWSRVTSWVPRPSYLFFFKRQNSYTLKFTYLRYTVLYINKVVQPSPWSNFVMYSPLQKEAHPH